MACTVLSKANTTTMRLRHNALITTTINTTRSVLCRHNTLLQQHINNFSRSISSTHHHHTTIKQQQILQHLQKANQHTHLSKPQDIDEPTPLTEIIRDFLSPADFYDALQSRGLTFYTGVPDSLLKDYCSYVTDNTPANNHITAANEGSSIAIASGYHLATKQYPIVYMQNSGFGNAVNPLLSLCDPKVYSIPMLILCGYRGEPGKKDEPQHLVQGKVMQSMLSSMHIEYEILPDYIEGATESIDNALNYMKTNNAPYMFLVRRQTFTPYKLKNKQESTYPMTREPAIRYIVDTLSFSDIVVSTTGFASRELYEYRSETKIGHARDFLTVGCMGHASSIALGIAVSKHDRQVYVLDGDGAVIMHMGAMTTIGQCNVQNYKHIILNNGCHDSVGGQTSYGFNVKFTQIAQACNYKWIKSVSTEHELKQALIELRTVQGPALLEILIKGGARKNLGRPKTTPKQNKDEFIKYLNQ